VDAANVDLKAFTEGFYGRITLTHLQPVLDTLTWLKNETNVWFEITNLVIPTLNDDPREFRQLSDWILEHLGPDVPLHFTAFHPDFKLRDKPHPSRTLRGARIALNAGCTRLRNIYTRRGVCPGCSKVVIRCPGEVLENSLHYMRPSCGLSIPGRWEMRTLHESLPRASSLPGAKAWRANLIRGRQ
jgi:pyruvate formate lyase activating enzyme